MADEYRHLMEGLDGQLDNHGAIIDFIKFLPGDDTVQCPLEVDSIADGGNQQQKANDGESRLDWMVFNFLQ